MDRQEYQRLRTEADATGIGASEVAEACGEGRRGKGGPFWLYCKKLGVVRQEVTPEMDVGLVLEPYVAELYERRTGLAVHEPVTPIFRHPTLAWMFASPDRFNAEGRLVELKTARTAEGWGEEGTDQVPPGYLLQVQQQMHCCPVGEQHSADVAVLIAGVEFRVYTVPYRPDVMEWVTCFAGDLWDRIRVRKAPEPDWTHPDTPKLLDLLHRPAEGKAVDLAEDLARLANDYQLHAGMVRSAEKLRDECKARIIAAMGDAALGLLPDGRVVARNAVKVAARQCREYEYVNFHIRNPRKGQ